MQKKKHGEKNTSARQTNTEFPPEEREKQAAAELLKAPERYAGLYGAVLHAANGGGMAGAVPLHEFLMRARIKNPGGVLCATLTDAVAKMEEQGEDACAALAAWLMECFALAGITYDREETRRLDASCLRDYTDETGRKFREGEKVVVLSPSFRCKGYVIERGIARKSHTPW